MDIDKSKFIKNYNIDDNGFIDYLNKTYTLKKIINLGNFNAIPREKLLHLYNIYVYYKSLGHTTLTILEETKPNIKNLFFFNGYANFMYTVIPNSGVSIITNVSKICVSDSICTLILNFTNKNLLNNNLLLFSMIPAPKTEFQDIVNTTNGIISLKVNNDGISLVSGDLPANTTVKGVITYSMKI